MIAIGGLWRRAAQSGAERRRATQSDAERRRATQSDAASSMVGTLWKVALNLLRRRLGPTDLAEHAQPC